MGSGSHPRPPSKTMSEVRPELGLSHLTDLLVTSALDGPCISEMEADFLSPLPRGQMGKTRSSPSLLVLSSQPALSHSQLYL